MLRDSSISNDTFKWVLIGVGSFIALLALICGILAILWCVRVDENSKNLSKVDTNRAPVAAPVAPVAAAAAAGGAAAGAAAVATNKQGNFLTSGVWTSTL